ncbi:DNA mismatch repair protein MutS [Trichonephila inaurata madagascariensis]|uniref:DNA mismatch repair protein MutS n=1 Tax=Trichonephila inaurata madagascariensis TaxID=2747483 RepID=A0A8X7CST6_9ARAC|nr:DNA mismatch repair protein MutS [Trichonephila inaurata madagascariensis]
MSDDELDWQKNVKPIECGKVTLKVDHKVNIKSMVDKGTSNLQRNFLNTNNDNSSFCLDQNTKSKVDRVGEVRVNNGRKEKTSFCIIDAQSVKNTDTAEEKGYDTGKKISGIKRHIAVDTQGLPHAIHITTAEATDRSSAVKMVKNAKANPLKLRIYWLMLATQEKILQLK